MCHHTKRYTSSPLLRIRTYTPILYVVFRLKKIVQTFIIPFILADFQVIMPWNMDEWPVERDIWHELFTYETFIWKQLILTEKKTGLKDWMIFQGDNHVYRGGIHGFDARFLRFCTGCKRGIWSGSAENSRILLHLHGLFINQATALQWKQKTGGFLFSLLSPCTAFS